MTSPTVPVAFQIVASPPDGLERRRFVHVIGTSVFTDDRVEDESWATHFVGVLDGHALYAVDVPDGEDPSYGAHVDLRRLFTMVDEATWVATGRAVQVVEWARTHRFCGRCASPTVRSGRFMSMECPACGLQAFPRLSPAMITLVTRGDDGPDQEVLLARGVGWPQGMLSCLAGFVEAGEMLEDCVVREVREEVGITVTDVRYQSSQPWPFPHSLMIGFRARYESGDLVLDETEIAEAGWFRRPAVERRPNNISISGRLIDAWLDEESTIDG
jgi:NAD+ diphosphatase